MLMQINIRDFATIENLQLALANGTTMITGETGAGKSIFIEAIELALGARATQHSIRHGKEKADISLCFDISHFPHVISKLKHHDLYLDANDCIIRRVIMPEGRSRCYVNGIPVTLQMVKELGELLFHLHSQHEQQVLLRADKQREMLDRYADHLPLVQQVKQFAERWKALAVEINTLRAQAETKQARMEYLRFQLEELQAANLSTDEWETLEAEHKRLSHHEELFATIALIVQRLNGEHGNGTLSALHEIRKMLETITNYEAKTHDWLASLQSALIPLSDLESELQTYIATTENDPTKLRTLETRISQLFNLARKHKIAPPALANYMQELSTEYAMMQASDETQTALLAEQKQVAAAYSQSAQQLSLQRQKAAHKLEKEITTTIRALSLPHGAFQIQLIPEDPATMAAHGLEKIVFLIKTNPEQTLHPLAKVISGGELSRLSLAVHLALAHKTNIPTLIFDEVDTGLSGATAEKIGKLLQKLGQTYQVFCVTHQPQVAACGQQHLLVAKEVITKTTHTRMRLLTNKEKTQEIARMLGGSKITTKTLAHAAELLES